MTARSLVADDGTTRTYQVFDDNGDHIGWDEEQTPAPLDPAVAAAAAVVAQQADPDRANPRQADVINALCVLAAADPQPLTPPAS